MLEPVRVEETTKVLRDIDSNLAGFAELWQRERNPMHVWCAIEICTRLGAATPDWVQKYLHDTATGIADARFMKGADVRKILPKLLQFEKPRGGGGSYVKDSADMLFRERLAMAFAAEIFAGRTPAFARSNIANLDSKEPDDRTVQRHLSKFFRVGRVKRVDVSTTAWWQT